MDKKLINNERNEYLLQIDWWLVCLFQQMRMSMIREVAHGEDGDKIEMRNNN